MKNHLWIIVILIISHASLGQDSTKNGIGESAEMSMQNLKVYAKTKHDDSLFLGKKFIPDPKLAMHLAMVLPGSGQIYNRDYWKAPLVVAALVGGTWTAVYWHIRYKDFVEAYKSFYDLTDPTSKHYGKLKASLSNDPFVPVFYRGGILNGQSETKRLTVDQVKRIKNSYYRYFQTAVVVTAALYVASIIEAHVAAHMKSFDLSDDLTLRIEPKLNQLIGTRPVPGIRMVLAFN
jgi:hypothetical protein